MSENLPHPAGGTSLKARADHLFEQQHRQICVSADHLFARLMVFQWLAGIAAALWISPRAWAGAMSATHPHVWGAIFLGAVLTAFPVFLALRRPGRVFTRHSMAVGQMLTSALLIHLMGGRIETHFHVFGSLAFLAFYRDPRVIITATVVVAADHLLRGYFWPQSVFGVISAPVWRALEHAGWVVFEDFFLIIYIGRSLREMRRNADQQAQLEATNVVIERTVKERTSELEVSNKELESFSYSVSHDLRSPLRAVDGYSRMLIEDYTEKLDDEGRRMLGVIRGETQRMGRLIDDLLAFSRLGRQQMEPVPIDMHVMAREVFDEQAALEPERKLRLSLSTLTPTSGTEPMIRQVWVNLISNAIKFTRERAMGEIEIGERDGESGECIYSIKDNGAGFDMRHADKLFGVFQRLHSAGEFQGTGVGLALVHRIVQRHGGRIWAEAKINGGATFHFTIPKRKL